MEFARAMFEHFKDRIFFLLDSDRSSADEQMDAHVRRLITFFREKDIANFHVLRRRELENYLDRDKIAEVAGMHSSVLRAVPGHEDWQDVKAQYQRAVGAPTTS